MAYVKAKRNKKSKEQIKNEVNQYTETLNKGILDFFETEKYKDYLKFISVFHNYSYRNSALIYLQNPAASHVAGFNTWKKIGRTVNKGEKALRIFAPIVHKYKTGQIDEDGKEIEKEYVNYYMVPVFDVSQTSGNEIPSITTTLFKNVDQYDEILKKLIYIAPVKVEFGHCDNGNGFYSEKDQRIFIENHLPQSQKIKTLIHEISHSILHGKNDELDRNTEEVQAESIAYVVSQHLGIDTSDYSFGYIASWSKGKELKELQNSLNIIQKTSSSIIESLA